MILEYEDVSADVAAELKESEQLHALVLDLRIADPNEGDKILDEIRKKRQEIVDMNEIALAPFNPIVQAFQAIFDKIYRVFEDMDIIVRSRTLAARSQLDCARAEAIRDLEKAYAVKDDDKLAVSIARLKDLGMSEAPTPGRWDFEIVDKSLIPPEFTVISQPAIMSHVLIYKDLTKIPGVRVFRKGI